VTQNLPNSAIPSKEKNFSWFKRVRMILAGRIVKILYGREMTITPFQNSAIAGLVVFWYLESGVRHFVMIKNSKLGGESRFVSCIGLGTNKDITEATQNTVKGLLGSVFYKSLDNSLITQDRVASVPTFKCEDPLLEESVPVNGVVWALQITPEQAQLCQPKMKNIDVVAIPEYAISGNEVASSHQMVYQSVLRHIHGVKPLLQELGMEQVEDAFKDMMGKKSSSKIIH
jgi:hypothetical protein